MLTRLIPDQISNFWPIIKYSIEQALPPTVGEQPDKMNRILSAMLCGKLDVWASYRREGDVTKFEGIVVTQFLYDEASNTRSLLIYAIHAYIETLPDTWEEAFEALSKYAIANHCVRCVAYSSVPNVVEHAKQLGADTSFTFISFNLQKSVK